MTGYQSYPEYKDSGVEWLGEIPKHWDVWKVTHGFNRIGSGTTPRSENTFYYDGEIPWVTTSELRETIVFETARNVTREAVSEYSALKLYPVGSIAIAMYGATIGRLGIFGVEATVNQACCVYSEPTKFNPSFFYYWLWMRRPILISLSNGGGQPNLSQDDLKKLWVPIPDIDEQQTIASFLDYKTTQINTLMAKKQTLLEKLVEKRTALISHAVTKGLDPKVKMKDSGVEWLGKVPAHWKAVRLKHTTHQIVDGAHFTPTYVDEGVPFLRVTDIVKSNGSEIDTDNLKFIPEDEHKELCKRCKPRRGDVLYSKNGTIGIPRVVDWDYDFSVFVSLCLLKINKKIIDANFLCMSLLGKLTEHQISIGAKSNTVTNLHLDKIKEFWVCLPPMDEQIEIVNYLSDQVRIIDKSVSKANYAIEKLKEYRSALITDAVTGKIDVRNIKIPDAPAKGQAV